MHCRALIFDLFGVVVAFDEAAVYRRLAERCLRPAVAFESMHGLLSTPAIIEGRLTLEQVYQRLVAEQGLALSYHAFNENWLTLYTTAMPGIADVLKELTGSYRLILLSNIDRYYLEVIRANHPELDYFLFQLVSCELGCSKPSAKAFEAALQVAEAEPGECYFIDDKPENVFSARKIGIPGHVFVDTKTLQSALIDTGILASVPSAA